MRRLTLRQQTVIGLSVGFAIVQIFTSVVFAWLSYALTERDVRGYLTREGLDLVRTQFVIRENQLTYIQDAEGNTVTDRLRKRGISALVVNPEGTAINVFGIYRTFISEGEDARSVGGIREAIGTSFRGFSHLTLSTNEQFETYTFPLESSGKIIAFLQVARDERSLSDILSSSSLIMLALIPLSILLSVFLSLWIVRRALSPLERLSHAVRRIPEGVFPDHVPAVPDASPEYVLLSSVINRLLSSLAAIFARHKEFIGNVAHELRTPLTRAITAVDVMVVKDKAISPSSKHALLSIQDDLLGVSSTIDGLMSVSRLYEADQKGTTETNTLEVIHQIIRDNDEGMLKKNIRVTVDVGSRELLPMPPPIAKSLLGNIINNAIKYSRSDGAIRINATSTKQELRITISDNGIGMSPEISAHIFDRRFRGTNASSGHGVGLSLVRRIADMWGVGIFLKSKQGEGTTVTLTMRKQK